MERKGFLTPEQEKQVDDLIEAKGLVELFDGPVIKLADNQGLERLKAKLDPASIEVVYEVVDEIFSMLPTKK